MRNTWMEALVVSIEKELFIKVFARVVAEIATFQSFLRMLFRQSTTTVATMVFSNMIFNCRSLLRISMRRHCCAKAQPFS